MCYNLFSIGCDILEELKTNKAAFYVAEVFVILFLLTIIMGVTLLFKNSYSAPVTTELPSLPFTKL